MANWECVENKFYCLGGWIEWPFYVLLRVCNAACKNMRLFFTQIMICFLFLNLQTKIFITHEQSNMISSKDCSHKKPEHCLFLSSHHESAVFAIFIILWGLPQRVLIRLFWLQFNIFVCTETYPSRLLTALRSCNIYYFEATLIIFLLIIIR